jgi:hypothetical protein
LTRHKIISHGQDHHGDRGQDRNSWLFNPQTSAAWPQTSSDVQFSLEIRVLELGAFRRIKANGGQDDGQTHS